MTPRETILQALFAALQSVSGATVLRGAILPERIPVGGLLILRDGDPGTPEVTLSPLQYHFEHRAEVEVIVQDKTPAARDAAFDTLLQSLGVAIALDRTLGGLCDWVEGEAPQPVDLPVEGAEALKAAVVPAILTYTTADPLG
ncbi:acyl-CoA transferase [Profundibacter sp.]|uniref:acyl-CoA transferase n=1 Tax=Profundibacter sp. TaxID=3101071 RepID=UPI003D11F7E4